MGDQPGEVSQLLQAWGQGSEGARKQLMELVYGELRRRAAGYLRSERSDHTLQPTALVHEAYLRLIGQDRMTWRNRAQFFGIASQMMRRILVDHARERHAAKRPGEAVRVTLTDDIAAAPVVDCDLLQLDRSLDELSQENARQAQIVELRYFGGMSESAVATLLNVSRATITREWQAARRSLYGKMTARGKDTARP
jgi:RNA polymerase sigma factor (TIGR02999 family)